MTDVETFKAMEARAEMDRRRMKPVGPHEHVDSGWSCLVAHGDRGPCWMCSVCGDWQVGTPNEVTA